MMTDRDRGISVLNTVWSGISSLTLIYTTPDSCLTYTFIRSVTLRAVAADASQYIIITCHISATCT